MKIFHEGPLPVTYQQIATSQKDIQNSINIYYLKNAFQVIEKLESKKKKTNPENMDKGKQNIIHLTVE